MIAIRSEPRGIPAQQTAAAAAPAPHVDLRSAYVDDKGIHFPPGSLKNGQHVLLEDPRTHQKVSLRVVKDGGVDIPFDGYHPRGAYKLFVAGEGGWKQISFESGGAAGSRQPLSSLGGKVRNVPPSVDGSQLQFSQIGVVSLKEPTIIGYDQVTLTIRHPYTGEVRTVKLDVDTLSGTFPANLHLGLAPGDEVKVELSGPNGKLQKQFVFPDAPNRSLYYSLDELTRG